MEFENYKVEKKKKKKRFTGQTLHKTHVCKFVYLFMRHPDATARHGRGGVVVYFSMTCGV